MAKSFNSTIQSIVISDLCTGCGTCAGICPNSAIDMIIDYKRGLYVPQLDPIICTGCGICLKACPGDLINIASFNSLKLLVNADNALLGNFRNSYLANSIDDSIRFNSSSGGSVTSLLIFALESGLIDGALVTRMDKDNPLLAVPFIAKTKEEIIEASQSKYCPVSTNTLINELLTQNGKFAVVGLPCQIKGLKMAEEINVKLKEKVILHFGLFCSHTNSYFCTDFLLKKLKINKEDIQEIRYRCNGWPGGMLIKLSNSTEKYISNQSSFWNTLTNGFFFTPRRCLLCDDVTAELADISFGDPWLPELMKKEKVGISVLIARSEFGQRLIFDSSINGSIQVVKLDPEDIIRSQKLFLHFKKINLFSRIRIYGLGKENLNFYPHVLNKFSFNTIIAIIPLMNSYLGQKKKYRTILRYVPFFILKYYVTIYYIFYSKILRKEFDTYAV